MDKPLPKVRDLEEGEYPPQKKRFIRGGGKNIKTNATKHWQENLAGGKREKLKSKG